MDQKTWLSRHLPSLQNKTVAITGATGGLGREICRGILMQGGSLLLLNRSREKTEMLQKQLKSEFPQAEIAFLPVDLQDFDSVKALCSQMQTMPIDILLHNAGIYDVPRFFCSTGLINVFQVNFAAPYYMTKQLLPLLRQRKGRVAVVGSIAHTYSLTDPADPDFHSRNHCHLIYGNSKRYLMFALGELLQNESQVSFSIGHPGITVTNISNHYPDWLYAILKWPMKILFMKPRKACRGILTAVSRNLPEGTWAGPRYFCIWGNPAVKRIGTCPEAEQQQIFRSAEKIYAHLEAL